MPHRDLAPWRRLVRRAGAANPYWRAFIDRVQLPGGAEHDYHFVQTPGSVLIVPIEAVGGDEPRVLMVRQYRYLMGTTAVEFPGGGVKPGQTPLEAARAELREEAGCVAASWQPIGQFNPCKGLLDEACHVFLARGVSPDGEPVAGDPTEEVEPLWVPAGQVDATLRVVPLADGMSLAAWAMARHAVFDGARDEP